MSRSRDQPVLTYVVHKHLAHKLHYDLRLQLGSNLKSWTIPRGPSMDSRVKRFATEGREVPFAMVNLEDSDDTQKIIVWDKGSLEFSGGEAAFIKGLERGRLTFVLRGKKLHGAFSLFKFVGNRQWLLVKRHDKYATSEDVTQNIHSVISRRILRDPEVKTK